MRRKDDAPIEPTPESNPYGYLAKVLGGKQAREIKSPNLHLGLLRLYEGRNPVPAIQIHVFDELGESNEFFAIHEKDGLLAARIASTSALGLRTEDFLGLKNYAFSFDDRQPLEERFEEAADRAELLGGVISEDEKRIKDPFEEKICIMVAKAVEKCLNESIA